MSEPFLGEIRLVGYNFAPKGWAFCAGQLLPISQNQALYALMGSTFGGNDRTELGIPDLRGRAAIGAGQGIGLTDRRLGQMSGAETVRLSTAELAQHSHTATVSSAGGSGAQLLATTEVGDSATPTAGSYLAQATPPGGGMDKPEQIYKTQGTPSSTVPLGGVSAGAPAINVTNSDTGLGNAHFNMQPYLVLNYIIALQGLFPSRN